jgi:hypothetical protein
MDFQLNSYATVYALGHKAIADIFSMPVVMEEKIDGSQFSMGVFNGKLLCRSKSKQLITDAAEKMFTEAVETAKEVMPHMREGWIYRCEYLKSPKHNALPYSRIPQKHLIVFDVAIGIEQYLAPAEKLVAAEELGLECVPVLYEGVVGDFEMFKAFLERESILGGCKVEGVVIKAYNLFTQEKKIAIGKYVSEAYKEVQQGDWKGRNPSGKDFMMLLVEKYRTEARWNKAIQHLRDVGQLEGSPRDIGVLIREIPADILKEEKEAIMDVLFKHFWPHFQRGVTRGFPDFYKKQLAESAFGETGKRIGDVRDEENAR